MPKQKILIVEDTIQFREIYADILQNEGYEVIEANDGSQALEILKHEKPDLILTDIMMAPMGGIEFLKRKIADDEICGIPVIILTVLGRVNDVRQAMNLGAQDYIEKGTQTPMEVASKVGKFLELSKQYEYKVLLNTKKYDAIKLLKDSGFEDSGF